MAKAIIPANFTISNMICAADSSSEFSPNSVYSLGQSVQVASENSVYKSLINNNTAGSTPSVNIANSLLGIETKRWVKDGATNPSRLTDDFLHSQTVGDKNINNGSISFDVSVDSIDAFALLNIEADTIEMKYIANDGVTILKQQTKDLIINSDLDMVDYIFNETDKLKNNYLVYLPRTYLATVQISLRKQIGVAKVGIVLCGKTLNIGHSKWQIETPKKNYGKRIDDEFGISTFITGKKAKTMKVDCLIPSAEFSIINRQLDDLLDSPTLFLGDALEDGQEATWVYGNLKSALPILDNDTTSRVLLKINGLI